MKCFPLLCFRYGALVFVDECHATGFFGQTGRGTEEFFGLVSFHWISQQRMLTYFVSGIITLWLTSCCIRLLCLCWISNGFTCSFESKPVKQDVSCTVTIPLQVRWVFNLPEYLNNYLRSRPLIKTSVWLIFEQKSLWSMRIELWVIAPRYSRSHEVCIGSGALHNYAVLI